MGSTPSRSQEWCHHRLQDPLQEEGGAPQLHGHHGRQPAAVRADQSGQEDRVPGADLGAHRQRERAAHPQTQGHHLRGRPGR